MAEAFRPDGRLNIPTQAAADYIAEQGQLVPYEPTIREKTQQAIANFLSQYGGLSNFDSYNMAEGVTGSTRPDARNPLGIGLMDFTPAGLVFGGQEAARDFDKAQTATDYIAPTIGLGLSAVEAFPLTKAITKPAAAFLSNLGRKTSSDIVPTPEPLIASSGPTIPRRTFVQGMAATPVAGALSKLPLGKIDDLAPVAKTVRVALPNDIYETSSFLNSLKSDVIAKSLSGKYGEQAKILAQTDPDNIFDVVDTPSTMPSIKKAYEYFRYGGKRKPNELAQNLMEEYPDASPTELANLIGKTEEAGSNAYWETFRITEKDIYGDSGEAINKNLRDKTYDWGPNPKFKKPPRFDDLSEGQKDWVYKMSVNPSHIKNEGQNFINQEVKSILDTGMSNYWQNTRVE